MSCCLVGLHTIYDCSWGRRHSFKICFLSMWRYGASVKGCLEALALESGDAALQRLCTIGDGSFVSHLKTWRATAAETFTLKYYNLSLSHLLQPSALRPYQLLTHKSKILCLLFAFRCFFERSTSFSPHLELRFCCLCFSFKKKKEKKKGPMVY